jgi:DNA-binding NarL/FixJ family response regulator
VVAVTAFAMRGDEERIREGGCEAYLSKPIPLPEFIETVRRFLGPEMPAPTSAAPKLTGRMNFSLQRSRGTARRTSGPHSSQR